MASTSRPGARGEDPHAGRPLVTTRLVTFDLDGCLVDSTRAITGALRHAFEQAGLPIPADRELHWCVGPPLVGSVERLLREVGGDPGRVGPLIDAYRARYRRSSLVETEVIPGITEVLHALGRRTRLAVVTSKPAVFAEPILATLGLRDHFEAVEGPDADHAMEPKTRTLARALERLAPDLPPAEVVMVGDHPHDVAAGRSCGTRTVGVTWGTGDRGELERAGADHVVSEPAQLLELLT